MSEVIYLNADRTFPVLRSQPAQTRDDLGPRIYVRQAHAGMWIVHDEVDGKGGCFRSHDTAMRFAEIEFGANAQIVLQPHFSGPSRRAVGHFKQSTSVAHRALAAS